MMSYDNPPIYLFEEDFKLAEKIAEINNQDVLDYIFGEGSFNESQRPRPAKRNSNRA